jgi:hypothetical protein
MSENEFSSAEWDESEDRETQEDTTPAMGSREWNDYVLSLLTDEEKDSEGHPRCDGLRRVMHSLFDVISTRSTDQKVSKDEVFINWEVKYLPRKQFVMDLTEAQLPTVTVSAFASANLDNTKGVFQRHLAAVADSKAEARCYRKALLLNKVTAEEVQESTGDELISAGPTSGNHQSKAIDLMCQKLGCDLDKFLKYHRKDISNKKGPKLALDKLNKEEAAKALNILNRYQSNNKDHVIPDEIKV